MSVKSAKLAGAGVERLRTDAVDYLFAASEIT